MGSTQVKINPHYRAKLEAIVQARKDSHHPVKQKQQIVEQLIEAAHKKEVK
jgi:hypothetical protein